MSEVNELRLENEALRRQLADAMQAIDAFSRGQVDAVVVEASATPILLEAAQAEMRRSQVVLRGVFEGSLDAILLANDRRQFVDANRAACEMFGLDRDELLGLSPSRLAVLGFDIEKFYAAVQGTGRAREPVPLRRRDGTCRTLDCSAVASIVPGLHLFVLCDITERVSAEERVRRSEARFRTLAEKSSDVISVIGPEGTTLYVSPTVERLLGRTPEHMVGEAPGMHVLPEDRPRVAGDLERVREAGEDVFSAYRMIHSDGSIRWFEGTLRNLLGDPNVGGIVTNFRDVTERKEAEEALRTSEADFRLLAEAMPQVVWITAADGSNLYFNQRWMDYTGLTLEESLGGGWIKPFHPDDRELAWNAWKNATTANGSYALECRLRRADGVYTWWLIRGVPVMDKSGNILKWFGTCTDIEELKAAQARIAEREERLRRIVEGTTEGIWTYDADGVTTFANGRFAQMLGYTVAEMVGQPVFAFLAASEHALAGGRVARRREGVAEGGDFRFRRKDGTEFLGAVHSNPLFGADGRFEAGLVIVTDVSAQRVADEARARLASIVDSSEDAVVGTSLDGLITSWNLGAAKLYGFSSAEVIGTSVLFLAPEALRPEEERVLERVAAGEAVLQRETRRRRKDGSIVEVSVTLSPVRESGGAVIGVSKIGRDLTARRQTEAALHRTEEQFRQAQKMEAIGRLAGGVAHDFNNLLSVILSYSHLMIETLKPSDPLREDMEQIQLAGQRATGLTRQLLAFSRQQVLAPRVTDLNQIVDGMKAMLGRLLGEDIELAVLTYPSGRVFVDPGQIEQVVMNLAVNARDAMPEGGKLTIEVSNVAVGAPSVGQGGDVPPGRFVMLTVVDTGVGMDSATRLRIFEPFFTTKAAGKGTGLGLATVFGIVQQSGGYISLESEPGHGTTFKVYLPPTDQVADATMTSSMGPPAPLRGTETILLVEDDVQVRTVASTILRRKGYIVLEAANGGEAFLIASDSSSPIHLLLTDVVMPRMSGRKLAEQLASQRPEMKVLFVSGYTDDAIIRHGVREAGVFFLQKPFSPEALLRKVRDVLGVRSVVPAVLLGALSGDVGSSS